LASGKKKTAAKRAAAKKPKAAKAEPRIPGRIEAEAVALLLFALAGFVEVALFSYDPADPSWFFTGWLASSDGPRTYCRSPH